MARNWSPCQPCGWTPRLSTSTGRTSGATGSTWAPTRTSMTCSAWPPSAPSCPANGSSEKTVKRKLVEMLIAVELEHKFSKQRIFEMYANEVYMGQRGSFTINGFAQASHAYFNKDIKNLTLPEAALLAGMIQRPNYLSPYKSPKRALERRNLVLDSMVETGAITREQADRAKAVPLKVAPPNVEASDAPYFVDLVKDQLSNQFSEAELNDHAYRVYTTLDPDLQRAAAEAVDAGMKLVDEQVEKRRTHKIKVGAGKDAKTETKVETGPMPQV